MRINHLLVFFSIFLTLFCVNSLLIAETIQVPSAQPTIQSGIDAAQDGDTVLVADGTYKGDGNVNIDFMGKAITLKSANGPHTTIVDCMQTPETRGFIFQNQETNKSILEGFTIKNGIHDLGGGIHISSASPTIKNCVISENIATAKQYDTHGGGGIYMLNSDAIITGCTISSNTAESTFGGGIFLQGDWEKDASGLKDIKIQPGIVYSKIIGNSGSGIYTYDGSAPLIKNCLVSENTGRGIEYDYFARSTMPITNCIITQNNGGGLAVGHYSSLKITKSVIKNNTAKQGGGINCGASGVLIVSDCIIAENFAQQHGGGIAVRSTWGHAEISNCTITRNTANVNGGGVYALIELSLFDLINSIVWGNNSNGKYHEFAAIGRRITIESSDIKDGLEGIGRVPNEWIVNGWFIYENNIDADPLFVDADGGDYNLKLNSPAKNMGASFSNGGVLSVNSVGKRIVKWGDLKRR